MLPVAIGPAKRVALGKVPYIALIPKDGRIISLQPYFDESEKTFKQPVPKDDGIIFLKGKPEQGSYYARSPVDNGRDVYLRLADFITRYCSFPPTMKTLIGVERDFLNCSVVVEKYFILLDLFRKKGNPLIANLVMTDIEFLFSNIRSVYDSLQMLTKDVLKHHGNSRSRKLPDSYYHMVKLDDAEMKRKYNLPDPLMGVYSSTRNFFLDCRRIRDGFRHYRIDIPVIFSLDEGFALQKDSLLFSDPVVSTFDIWPTHKVKANNLVSVLALISYLNKTVLTHAATLSEALEASVSVPPPVLRDQIRLFLRGPYTHHLVKCQRYLEEQWIPSPNRIAGSSMN